MSPTDVLSAYDIPSSASANGKIVAILDSPDSNALDDLAAYRQNYGLAPMQRCAGMPTGSGTPCFAQVAEDGGASTGGDSGEDGDAETSLDMDMISAACPDCSILLVEIGDTNGDFSDQDFVTGAKTASRLGASAVSISIGGPEGAGPDGQGGMDPIGYTTPGHLVLAASGDFGYDLVDEGAGVETPSYPASAPDILSVGGTMLFNSGSGTYSEAVWNDAKFGGGFSTGQNGQDVTTSGCSTEFSAPSWQDSALTGTGCANRATADVSAAAAFVYAGQLADIPVYQQGWAAVEGTSASSPMVAAILTRLGLTDAISANLGWPYANATGFHDLGSTSYPSDPQGSDTDSPDPSSCGKLCTVAAGWDGPSGVGTPNGTKLAQLGGTTGTTTSSSGGGSTTTSSSTVATTTSSSGGEDTLPSSTGGAATGTGLGTGGLTIGGASSGEATGQLMIGGTLGSLCTGPSDCTSPGGLCAEPNAASKAVCTQTCSADALCPTGFDCTDGYCFAAPPVASSADGGAGGGDNDSPSSGSSGGCSVASTDGTDWSGIGWLSFGLVAVVRRRRKSA
jgi:MYXO-CTERM domain-containing protein